MALDPPRRRSRPLLHPIGGRSGLVRKWLPGETHTHWRPEPPGRYVLRVSGAGWETLEKEIELFAGEDAFVRATVVAR